MAAAKSRFSDNTGLEDAQETIPAYRTDENGIVRTSFTSPTALDRGPVDSEPPRVVLSLFWRTFFLIGLLVLGSVLAWLQTLRVLELDPRASQTAQQLSSLVNLSRAAIVHSDAIGRVSLIKALAEQEGLRIIPREVDDKISPPPTDSQTQRVLEDLKMRLGKDTLLSTKVNGETGMWIGFSIDGDAYWLLTDPRRLGPLASQTWLVWLGVATLLSLAGAALIARLINRPIKQLSFAASRVREGDFESSMLDERTRTSEIREMNVGFNRMAQQLAQVEQDRALMLAGISHDLRTPLARLRLETEMSVSDAQARQHMANDIEQLDAIIGKFLDYARPDHVPLQPMSLHRVVENAVFSFRSRVDMQIKVDVPAQIIVMADEVELGRVLTNLLENARKYGKTTGTGIANVEIAAKVREEQVLIKLRDRGPGVSPEMLDKLTQPFYRGDAARTSATGAGLGLSIVERTLTRMGGTLNLANTSSGGLAAHISLHKARNT